MANILFIHDHIITRNEGNGVLSYEILSVISSLHYFSLKVHLLLSLKF